MPRKSKAQIKSEAKQVIEEFVEQTIKEKEEAQAERVPGMTLHGVKTSWRRSDVDKAFPICSFIPDETIPVTYNGVRYQLLSGIECLVPTIIRDIYNDRRRRIRETDKLLKSSNVFIERGVGGLPQEP